MGKFFSSVGLLAAAATAATVIYAQKRSQQTGRDVVDVLGNLPAELKESGSEWQQKLRLAVDAGKQAAAAKEAEIEQQLGQREEQPSRAADYAV